MLKFRKYLVAVFATLLAVAASAADVPYGTNLLQNTNPDGTTFDPWVKTDAGSGWAISDGKFCSSNKECVLTQTVNLKDLGLTTEQTDSLTMLSMVNYEILWPGNYKCIAKVVITCKDSDGNNLSVQTLLDINQSNIEVSATLVTKSFLLPKGTTQLVYEMRGKDQVDWGGQYGPRYWGMYIGFAGDLTKTYTASAVAALGDTLVFSKTIGIKTLDTITVTSKYSDVRIKSISSGNSNVISSNQVVCMGADMTINAEFYRKHSIVASSSEYGTITFKKDAAFYGDTITVSHTMNTDTVRFAGYTTTPGLNWLNGSTFIMVDENVTIGMEVYKKHNIKASSEYGTITINKDAAIYGDTIRVSHTMNTDTVLFAGYTTTLNLTWVNDSTFIMPDEDVTIGMKVIGKDIPFREGFEDGNTHGQNVVGWQQQIVSGIGGIDSWIASSTKTETGCYRLPYSGAWSAKLGGNNIAWLFAHVYLEKGKRYVFSIYARQGEKSASAYSGISAMIGTEADKDSMKQVVLAETRVYYGDYQCIKSSFTADTDGVCWLGIRGNAGEYSCGLHVDNISLEPKSVIRKIRLHKEG